MDAFGVWRIQNSERNAPFYIVIGHFGAFCWARGSKESKPGDFFTLKNMKLASAVLASLRQYIHEVNFGFLRLSKHIREIKIHVYAKRQTSDSSWEFLRIENKQIKTVQDNCYV